MCRGLLVGLLTCVTGLLNCCLYGAKGLLPVCCSKQSRAPRMESMIKLFTGIGLDVKKSKETCANPKLSIVLKDIIYKVGTAAQGDKVTECSPHIGQCRQGHRRQGQDLWHAAVPPGYSCGQRYGAPPGHHPHLPGHQEDHIVCSARGCVRISSFSSPATNPRCFFFLCSCV